MSTIEYLAFIPLLLFGLAISDIINHWRSYLRKDNFYLPYVLSALMILESAIVTVYEYLQLLGELKNTNYAHYLLILIPPMLFLALTKVLTPDSGRNTEEYLKSNTRVIFTLAAAFTASHWFYDFQPENMLLTVTRIANISLLLIIAVTRNIRLVYLLFGLYLIMFISSLFIL